VLNPSEVGIATGRDAVLPPHVILEALSSPVAEVEGGIGDDEVKLEVLLVVVEEGVTVPGAEVALDSTDCEVHPGEPPCGGVGFLAKDGDVVALSSVGLDEVIGLDEHASRSAAWVIYPSLVGFHHLDEEPDHAAGGVELASLSPFSGCELAEEVFENPSQDVPGSVLILPESDCADEVHEFSELGFVEGGAGIFLGENSL